MGYIYLTTNKLNGKQYVGQNHNVPEKTKDYFGSGHPCLKNALEKYGKENFTKRVLIDNINNQEDLDSYEIYYIDYFNTLSPIGYNIAAGGNTNSFWIGRKHKKETKDKIKIKALARGKLSEEHKQKISMGSINKTKEYSEKMSLSIQKNVKEHPEIWNNKERCEKIANSLRGKKFSEERKKNISISAKKENWTEERKLKTEERKKLKAESRKLYNKGLFRKK